MLTDSKESLPIEETPLYEHYRYTVDKGQTMLRIDKYLYDHIENVSRNRIQTAAEAGCIKVNGQTVKSNYRVKPLDVITVLMAHPPYENEVLPENIPLDIVFEDDHLMVINKSVGMVVHPGHGNYTGTLINAIAWHLRNMPDYDPNDPQVGLVHRIDKDTSGLLVVAKTPQAKTSLGEQFYNKTTRRTYCALVWGQIKDDTGCIDTHIGRNPHDRLQMAVCDEEHGKHAITHFRVLERLGYVTIVECKLETGRTHQIRVHFKHLGHPLFNDERYGGSEILRGVNSGSYRQFIHNCFELCPRQALHACTLGFTHPHTGESLDFEAPLPADMSQLIDKWKQYMTHKPLQ